MPSPRDTKRQVVAAIGVLAGLSFVASLVLAVPLTTWLWTWLTIVTTLVFFYLLWRFVRAHERIAAALESDVDR